MDHIASCLGIARGPDETDKHLRKRLLRALLWPEAKTRNTQYLKLCLLLAKLDVKSARRDLPVGTYMGAW